MFFKVDFAKAFDSVDWNYLLKMLNRMKFPQKWIQWIEGCVTTAKANVLVNGSPSGEFALERGLRQGDPISPFLYLVAAEGLNLITKKAIKEGLLQAARIGKLYVEISYIQYVDALFFVVEGTKENESSKMVATNLRGSLRSLHKL